MRNGSSNLPEASAASVVWSVFRTSSDRNNDTPRLVYWFVRAVPLGGTPGDPGTDSKSIVTSAEVKNSGVVMGTASTVNGRSHALVKTTIITTLRHMFHPLLTLTPR